MDNPKSFRVMLVKRGQTEPDLDLMLSMLINEQNRQLLQPARGLFGAANAICNHRWLLSSEKLFFMMDADGRGCVAFDELQWLALATLSARGGNVRREEAHLMTSRARPLDGVVWASMHQDSSEREQ